MSAPDVSIIMPALNSARYIDEALESLQREEGIDAEIVVVVDDRSTDDTGGIVARRAAVDPRIRPVTVAGRGLFPSLNAGLAHSRAPSISFLDSDDLCSPGRLRRQLGKLAADPRLGAVVGETLMFEEMGPDLQPLPGTRWARILGPNLGAGTFRRAAIDAAGHFDESFVHGGDIDFLLRLHDSTWPMQTESELALLCRKHDTNMSSNPEDARQNLLRALRQSLMRRRKSGRLHDVPPFALMKPLGEITESESRFAGHRRAPKDETSS